MIHVYAVTRGPLRAEAELGHGVAGTPVTRIPAGSLLAHVSAHDEPPAAGLTALLEHQRVVDALSRAQTVVPMRFGTSYDDEDAVCRWLTDSMTDLEAALRLLDDKAEVGVRFLAGPRIDDEPAVDRASASLRGRALLQALADSVERSHRAHNAASDAANRVDAIVSKRASAATSVTTADDAAVLARAFLVPKGDVEVFAYLIEETARSHGVEAIVTGPWPPYSFARTSCSRTDGTEVRT